MLLLKQRGRGLVALLGLSLLSSARALSGGGAASASRMTSSRMKDDWGVGVTVTPANGAYRNVVVFCHGLGDTADGWASMVHMFGSDDTKYILPTAPTRPISLNGGMSMPGWSDVFGLHSNDKEDQEGFEQSKTRILKLIKEETDKNIPISRIAIGGFSQGGALALYTALTSSLNLAGVVALSTWLPLRDHVKVALTQEAKKLKILQVHGDADQVVAFQWGKESTELLSKLLASPPHFISISGMGHHADEKEIADVRKFLRDIFPPSP